MSNTNVIEKASTVNTTAVFAKNGKERYLLKMEWDKSKKSLTIIMTFPSSADDLILDQTTMLVRNNAVKHGFGSVSIVNLFSSINNENPRLDKLNSSFVMKACDENDVILIAYGRGTAHNEEKKALLEALSVYNDKLFTIIDSKNLPFSHPLSPLAHEWKIKQLNQL